MINYQTELENLQKINIEAEPRQRLSLALQRIKDPQRGPNILVAYVSAIEGFARTLVMHKESKSKAELTAVYPKYRYKGVKELITIYLGAKGISDPETFLGSETWRIFGYAIEYRNLLAHEATYLGQDKSQDLISTCDEVLRKLADLAGLEFNIGYFGHVDVQNTPTK